MPVDPWLMLRGIDGDRSIAGDDQNPFAIVGEGRQKKAKKNFVPSSPKRPSPRLKEGEVTNQFRSNEIRFRHRQWFLASPTRRKIGTFWGGMCSLHGIILQNSVTFGIFVHRDVKFYIFIPLPQPSILPPLCRIMHDFVFRSRRKVPNQIRQEFSSSSSPLLVHETVGLSCAPLGADCGKLFLRPADFFAPPSPNTCELAVKSLITNIVWPCIVT